MKFCAVVVAAVLIASCVASASDEGATKISVDSGLSGLLEESAEVISPGLLDSMIIDVEVTALGSIAQELIESIGITHNETVSKESLERLLEAAVTKVVENGTAAEEVVEEAEELVEETAVKSEVIPKGSNEGGIPIKVDKDACIDRYPFECPIYVERGECKENPGWMTVNW